MSSDDETGKLTASANEGWQFDWDNGEWLKNMEPYYKELIANAPIQKFWEGQRTELNDYFKARYVFPVYTGEQKTIEMDLSRWGKVSIDTIGVCVPDPSDPEVIKEMWVPIFFDKPIPPGINQIGQVFQRNEPFFYKGKEGPGRKWIDKDEFLQAIEAGDQLAIAYLHKIPDDPFIGPYKPNRQSDWLHDISLAQNHNKIFSLADQGEVVNWPDPFVITAYSVWKIE